MKVLVVDDDPAIRRLAATSLQREGFTVLTACDRDEGLARARAEQPGLVLLAAMLPHESGLELCRILRDESEAPIMLLVARDDPADAIIGPHIWADDYLTKPFGGRELVARVKAILHRGKRARRTTALLAAGPLVLDRARRQVHTRGRRIELRAKEFDLLMAFVEHAGLVLSREQILQEVWGYDVPGQTRTVDVHVNHLRRQLVDTGVAIETLRGVGYRLVCDE